MAKKKEEKVTLGADYDVRPSNLFENIFNVFKFTEAVEKTFSTASVFFVQNRKGGQADGNPLVKTAPLCDNRDILRKNTLDRSLQYERLI